jgi:Protein of unknown function (DUF3631)/Toprim domain
MPRQKTAAGAFGLSAEDTARLDTWLVEIAHKHFGEVRQEANGGWRAGDSQALVLHRNACWHDFRVGESGHGALSLLARLHHDNGETALKVARDWLTRHGGDGQLGRAVGDSGLGDEEDAEATAVDNAWRTAFVETLWECAGPIGGTPAEAYLKSRSIWPLPDVANGKLRWAPNARGDEGALSAVVTDSGGKVVAVQRTYITPNGEKAKTKPARQIFSGPHDWVSRGIFKVGAADATTLVLVEGVEDALSALMAGAERAHACLGAGVLGRAQLPDNVKEVIVARDDDFPGSAACVALGSGVARLLAQGRKVSVTPRAGQLSPGAKDLNDLLQTDIELARRQLSEADGISPFDKVEREALLDEISRLPRGVYEPVRRAVAKLLNWRAGALDDDRKQRRGRPQSEVDDEATKAGHIEPWPDPVLDLASVLELAVEQMQRFLIVPSPSYLDVAALWCAHSYLLRKESLDITFTPLLAFQSPLKRCGKSTALKCVHLMSCNAHLISSISASSLFRIIDEFGVSLMLDEADNVFRDDKSDLLAVLNAGRDRLTARVMRVESLGDGKFKVRVFNTFTAVALSSIKALPATLQDRAIVLSLKRATHGERPQRLTLTERGPLINVGRRLARWAADLPAQSLPRPAPTGLHNRIEDSWFVLFQVAELAGGDWPERCRKAAHADLLRQETNDADGGRDADLLADVWAVFREQNRLRLFTEDLCSALNSLEESPWRLANGGKPVDGYFLKRHLADFLPHDSESLEPRKWREGAVQARGYHERHFEDAFVRYLGRQLPSKTQNDDTTPPDRESSASAYRSKNASHPSHPLQEGDSHGKSEAYGVTENGVPASLGHPQPSQNTVKDPFAEGAYKDQSKAKQQQNGGSGGAAVGDERVGGPLMESVQQGPSGVENFSGNSNDGTLIEFPRAVSVRRRRLPGAEV